MATVNEEQLCELEALRSIYPTELMVENESTPIRLSIRLGMAENGSDDDGGDDPPACLVNFELPGTYPEITPEIGLSAEDCDLEEEDVAAILEKLNRLALENVGLPMVFTIASAAQEELSHLSERTKQKRIEEENRRKLVEEEKDRRRLEGTPVTVETFLAWKARFDEEMGRNKRLVVDSSARRLTGREQFLKDASLCTSDIRLIEESGEELKIDESLYDDAEFDNAGLSDNDEEDDKD